MMGGHAAVGALVAAFVGNLAIAVLKLAAALATGSPAMLSEAAHSAADSANQVLLWIGIRRAAKPADELHPLGHGKEVYFWSFLVAIGIFAGGSAFSLYEGIHRLIEPATQEGSRAWAYAVLAGSIGFEAVSFGVALRAFRREHPGASPVAAIREARDPALFTVLLEDAAAMAGLVVALAGVALADLTGDPAFDAGASLCIGVLLAAVAGVMAREVHSLMLGESAHPDVERAIRSAIAGGPEVREVVTLRTLALGAGGVLVMLEARLDSATHGGDAARAADAVETRIRAASPGVRHVLVEPEV